MRAGIVGVLRHRPVGVFLLFHSDLFDSILGLGRGVRHGCRAALSLRGVGR